MKFGTLKEPKSLYHVTNFGTDTTISWRDMNFLKSDTFEGQGRSPYVEQREIWTLPATLMTDFPVALLPNIKKNLLLLCRKWFPCNGQQGPCIDWLSSQELWGGHFIDRIESAEFNEEFKRQQQQGPYDSIECLSVIRLQGRWPYKFDHLYFLVHALFSSPLTGPETALRPSPSP